MHRIVSNASVNGILFGVSPREAGVFHSIGGRISPARSGLRELIAGSATFRFDDAGMCECTVEVDCYGAEIEINGQVITDPREWLRQADPEHRDKVGFRISRSLGLAIDLDDERSIYITAFRPGFWDEVLGL